MHGETELIIPDYDPVNPKPYHPFCSQYAIWTILFRMCYIDGVTVAELIPVLQMAVGPTVLISGVGLLILSLTNRLGRVVTAGVVWRANRAILPNINTRAGQNS